MSKFTLFFTVIVHLFTLLWNSYFSFLAIVEFTVLWKKNFETNKLTVFFFFRTTHVTFLEQWRDQSLKILASLLDVIPRKTHWNDVQDCYGCSWCKDPGWFCKGCPSHPNSFAQAIDLGRLLHAIRFVIELELFFSSIHISSLLYLEFECWILWNGL